MTNQIVRLLRSKVSKDELTSDLQVSVSSIPKQVVIVDRREFMRGCLNSWIGVFCHEFDRSSVADVTTSLSSLVMTDASMAIFDASGLMLEDNWLDGQIAWLRINQPNVPIVAIIALDKGLPIAELVIRLRLQAYIPTSSSMEVATAILRLVAAGGTYIPYIRNDPPSAAVDQIHRAPEAGNITGLTPREYEVLKLLERGMSNKIIAYRLNLSQSTVKAHVHNIISKLKVHNRTEAAVASQHLPQILVE